MSGLPAEPLPNAPRALFGALLHHVRHQLWLGRWCGLTGARKAADRAFDLALQQMLEADLPNCSEANFREMVGRRRWRDGLRDLTEWASSLNARGGPNGPSPIQTNTARAANTEVRDQFDVGVEQTIASVELRLVGRPDRSTLRDGELRIVDFKSGSLGASSEAIRAEYASQLQLYALIAEDTLPDKKVRLFLEQGDQKEIPWSDVDREAIRHRLRTISSSLPAGRVFDAESLARPGVHCCRCRLRHLCLVYQREVPKWWLDGRGNPRPLPLDAWGELAQVVLVERRLRVELVGPIRGKLSVEGLSLKSGIQDLDLGTQLFLFSLEATEDSSQHGAMIHPRNFHELPPGPRWRRAWQLRAFYSSR